MRGIYHKLRNTFDRRNLAIRQKHLYDSCYFLALDIREFLRVMYYYWEHRLRDWGQQFEKQKSIIVSFLVIRRGSYQRPFLHTGLLFLVAAGVVGGPVISENYANDNAGLLDFTPPSAVISSLDAEEFNTITQVSEKPRDRVVGYEIQSGDTLSSIAETFGVSVDSIRWVNDNFTGDTLTVGDTLKIPPVSGLVVEVDRGDTVYSIAKRYNTDAQKIANWPFNDFADLDTFALVAGQTLVVPDGVPPREQPRFSPAPIATVAPGGTGQFAWPTVGRITQNPVSYHMALDIANKALPAVTASDGGTVSFVDFGRYGYGLHIIIDHGNGFQTLYAHLSEIYVNPGSRVGRGATIGRMGSTGRSTGAHLHFEIRRAGRPINPLQFLQ